MSGPNAKLRLFSALAALAAIGVIAAAGGGRAEAVEPVASQHEERAEQGRPALVRRLTEAQYRRTIADVFGPDIEVVGRFEPDLRAEGLLAVGSSRVSITPAGLEQYEAIARGIAAQVIAPSRRDALIGCVPGGDDPDGKRCATEFFTRIGLKLYRRPVQPAEVQALVATTLSAGRSIGGFDARLGSALVGMLTSPQFLFRIDVPARSGNSIDGYSKASRLSFLLWNTGPDDALLAAAANGSLDRADGLSAQVDRMIASPRFADGVKAFFADYLQLADIDTLSKDPLIYPAFSSSVAAATREQTLRTITDLVIDRQGDFRDLFTTRRLAMTRVLGPIYDVPVVRSGWYMHEFPASDPRAGLLTHASLLALHSHPGRTSPTLRGKAISEVLLCEKVPSPPANVNFAVVQDVNNTTLKTTRDRLKAHLDDEECASCHKQTDPTGLGLEQFDAAGQFRTREQDQTIDVTGTFEKTAYDGAAALGQLFRNSTQVSACFVQNAWRYASARDPGPADRAGIDALTRGFATAGYRVPALFRALALDPMSYSPGQVPPRLRTAMRTRAERNGS